MAWMHCFISRQCYVHGRKEYTFWTGGASAKHFQKRRVSSAAAEQTVVPSGDCARCSTRDVWPDISATCAHLQRLCNFACRQPCTTIGSFQTILGAEMRGSVVVRAQVRTFAMEGYFQRQSWFWLKPWLLRISFSCRLHCSEQTCAHSQFCPCQIPCSKAPHR